MPQEQNTSPRSCGRLRRTVKWGGLVLTAMLAVLWIVSTSWYYVSAYEEPQWANWIPIGDSWSISIQRGVLEIAHWKAADVPPDMVDLFRVLSGTRPQVWFIPLWTLALIAAILTAIAWYRDRSLARRLKQGHCPHCAFDLAGLAQSALCPECGKPRDTTT